MNQEKLIQDQFNRLPQALQGALKKVPWKSTLREIASANNLSQEQAESFENETLLVLYGFDELDNYATNLVSEVGVNKEAAINLSKLVDEKVFKLIADQAEKNSQSEKTSLESHPENLPMVEVGESVHSVAHDTNLDKPQPAVVPVVVPITAAPAIEPAQPRPATPTPPPIVNSHYSGGKDPYREPLA